MPRNTTCYPPSYTREYKNWSSAPAILSMDEACCLLHASEATVIQCLERGDFAGNKVGNKWKIDKESIQRYIQGNMVKKQSEDSTAESDFLGKFAAIVDRFEHVIGKLEESIRAC